MDNWNGDERRKNQGEFCSAHIPMTNAITRIETSLGNIEKGITQGITFKTAIIGSIVLIVFTIIGQTFLYGKLVEKVDRNTMIIIKMQAQIEALQLK